MFGLHRKRPHFRLLPAEVFGSINPRRIPALLLNPPPKARQEAERAGARISHDLMVVVVVTTLLPETEQAG